MRLPPLVPGLLLSRRKRFLAEVQWEDGRIETAHLPNPGRMTAALRADGPTPCWCSAATNPGRKLAWTVELTEPGAARVLVNPGRANAIVGEVLPDLLPGYARSASEVRRGAHRLDFCLEGAAGRCWVEVKCLSLAEDGVAAFPDAVSARATAHLGVLEEVVAAGDRAVLVLFVGRGDARRVRPADWIDPAWGAALRRVVAGGVAVIALAGAVGLTEIGVVGRLPVDL